MLVLESRPLSAAYPLPQSNKLMLLSNASTVGRGKAETATVFEPREDELLNLAAALEDELSFSGLSLLEECRWWFFIESQKPYLKFDSAKSQE